MNEEKRNEALMKKAYRRKPGESLYIRNDEIAPNVARALGIDPEAVRKLLEDGTMVPTQSGVTPDGQVVLELKITITRHWHRTKA